MKKVLKYPLLISFIVALDQYTKWIVESEVAPWDWIKVTDFLNIVNLHNRGMVFGYFSNISDPRIYWLITSFSLAAAVFVVYLFFKDQNPFARFCLSLIIAGAAGNLIDRIFKGYVVDFIDFHIKDRHWPAFNLADAVITVGSLLLVFYLLRGEKNVSDTP